MIALALMIAHLWEVFLIIALMDSRKAMIVGRRCSTSRHARWAFLRKRTV